MSTFKLSFSKSSSSKPNPKSKPSREEEKPNHEFLTEFDPSQTLTLASKAKLIIPPKENEWRPHKKMKNLDLPSIRSADGKPLEFEPESDEVVPMIDSDSQMGYGLNLRPGSKGGVADGGANNVDAIMMKKLRKDLEILPDDEGFEQFDEVPVDGFGAALLGGYGWCEGMGLGKNPKEDVKVVEFTRRTAKEGLGFYSDHDSNPRKKKEKDSGKVESSWVVVGKEVRIISGREMGSKGTVLEVFPGGESLILRLSRSKEKVKVGVSEVAELGSEEEEKCAKKLKELKIQPSDEDARRSGDKKSESLSREKERKESKRSHAGDVKHEMLQKSERGTSKVSWLRSHIRVRIISKEFKGGRFYLKKGEIVDVGSPTTCDICIDENREIIQGVHQDVLETALPRRGGPILVLLGKHKGVYGSLVEKNMDRETGVVEDADTRELLNVRLEQIAEYIGDPSLIGY